MRPRQARRKLAAAATVATVATLDADWARGTDVEPAAQGAFGVDGIVVDGANLFVNNISKGTLIKVPISGADSGPPVVIAGVTLAGLGGLRLLAANTIGRLVFLSC